MFDPGLKNGDEIDTRWRNNLKILVRFSKIHPC